MYSMDYDKLLDRVWSKLPEKLKSSERFELPEADSFIEGKTTIVRNLTELSNTLDRKPSHIIRFLSKEFAVPTSLEGNRVVIQRRLKQQQVQEKVNAYAAEYVLCHECGRPDTQITELSGEKIIKCTACGGWWPYRRIK